MNLPCSGPLGDWVEAISHDARSGEPRFRDQTGDRTKVAIRLFGGMAIGGQPIGSPQRADHLPRSRKTRALVALLALSAPKPISRLQLIALLWSQREKEQGRASLRQAVHELQDAPGRPWNGILLAERHHLSFDPRELTVDLLRATEPSAPGTALLALFQDGFLEDLADIDPSFDGWLLKERGRLRAKACTAGEAFLQEQQSGEEVIAVAQRLLRIDPAHDGAWRALIRAHDAAGDRAAASSASSQWREAIGLAPGQTLPPEMAAFLPPIRPSGPPRLIAPHSGANRFDVEPRRSTLRLGIRRMRVIGPDVDGALPAGLAEEVTTALSRFRWISCLSGSSLAAMAGDRDEGNLRWPDMDLDLILDGTIQAGGGRVRVTVRLLDMRAGGEVIWANRFDRDAADTLMVQEEVAAAIVAQVDPALLIREGERAVFANSRTASPRDLVLQAVPAIYRLDQLSFQTAGDLLEAALRADPNHNDALAWYAYWHLFLVGQGWAGDPGAATARAGILADSAVASDPNDARSLTLAGHVRGFLKKRPEEAAVLHDRAISLNPNLAIAWCFSGLSLSYHGDHDAAIRQMRQAIDLSPSDPHLFFFQAALITPHLLREEYQAAAASGRAAIELNPGFSSGFKAHLAALGHLGQDREAAEVMARLLKLEPGFNLLDAVRRSPLKRPEDIARYAEGLRRAGLPKG
jgi:DNA-binding SARP family transcriptional activator/TolB-like protein